MELEYKDIYDRYRNPLGRTLLRGARIGGQEYTLAVRVWIKSGDYFLIQQRQRSQRRWPGFWDCSAAGGVIAGETARQAAVREVKEELGITVDEKALLWACTTLSHSRFDDVFFIEQDIPLAQLCLQYSEVARVRWARAQNINAMIENGRFLPYGYFDRLLAMRGAPLRLKIERGIIDVMYSGVRAGSIALDNLGNGTARFLLDLEPGLIKAAVERLEQMLPQYTRLTTSVPRENHLLCTELEACGFQRLTERHTEVLYEKSQGFGWILQYDSL